MKREPSSPPHTTSYPQRFTVSAQSKSPEATTALSFEAAIQKLGRIVEELESGELPLEDSLKLFEQGVLLARNSQRILDDAEKRVEQLLGLDAEGKPIVKGLDEDD